MKAMTLEERIEWNYRYEERLGILCGDTIPTSEQIAIAKSEADSWLAEFRGELLL